MSLFLQQAHTGKGLPVIIAFLTAMILIAWVYKNFSSSFNFFGTYSLRRKVLTVLAMVIAWAAEIYFIYYLIDTSGK